MKLTWFDVLLILFGLFIAYQLLRKIIGGSWQTETLIIALLVFSLGLTWKMNNNLWKLNSKFDRHIIWHKFKNG
ncbi:MAG: hypothetical protein WC584_01430 [Candidatus Pacearchaeota archaeon]